MEYIFYLFVFLLVLRKFRSFLNVLQNRILRLGFKYINWITIYFKLQQIHPCALVVFLNKLQYVTLFSILYWYVISTKHLERFNNFTRFRYKYMLCYGNNMLICFSLRPSGVILHVDDVNLRLTTFDMLKLFSWDRKKVEIIGATYQIPISRCKYKIFGVVILNQ